MEEQHQNQPSAGSVITPGQVAAPVTAVPQPQDELPVPVEPQAPQTPEAPAPPNAANEATQVADGAVSWTASEYASNPKNTNWYALLAFSALVITVIVYLFTHSIISTVSVALLGVVVGVFAARTPSVLNYGIDEQGIQISRKFYPYTSFKSFSIIEEGAFNHVSLLPLKRFLPPLAIHYAPDDEMVIVRTLADYLPYEEHKADLVDSISRRVRF